MVTRRTAGNLRHTLGVRTNHAAIQLSPARHTNLSMEPYITYGTVTMEGKKLTWFFWRPIKKESESEDTPPFVRDDKDGGKTRRSCSETGLLKMFRGRGAVTGGKS